MRKLFSGILAAMLVASLCITGAFACHHGGCGGVSYVDADGDGVCDNRGTACGVNFVDADGDGVCDNYASGQGRGCGRGRGRGRHCR